MTSSNIKKCSKCAAKTSELRLCVTHEPLVVKKSVQMLKQNGGEAFVNSLAVWLRTKPYHQMSSPFNYALDLIYCKKCQKEGTLSLKELKNPYSSPLKLALKGLIRSPAHHLGDISAEYFYEVDENTIRLLNKFPSQKKNLLEINAHKITDIPYLKPARMYSILGSFLVVGTISFCAGWVVFLFKYDYIYDVFNFLGIFLYSILWTIPIFFLHIFLISKLLKNKETFARDLSFNAIVSFLTFLILLGPITVQFVNGYFDKSDSIFRNVKAIGISEEKYDDYLKVKSWRNNKEHEMILLKEEHKNLENDDVGEVLLTTRRGFLGFEWIEDYQIKNSEGLAK